MEQRHAPLQQLPRQQADRGLLRFTGDGTERVNGVQEGRRLSQRSLVQDGKVLLQALKGLMHRFDWLRTGYG